MKFSIIKHSKLWLIISSALVVMAIVFLSVWGVTLGIDFTGGSLLEFTAEGKPTVALIREAVDPILDHDFVVQQSEKSIVIRTQTLSEEKHQEIVTLLKNNEQIKVKDELRFDSIGPVIGGELLKKSIWALVLVFILIVAYMAFAFRKMSDVISPWRAGLITIIAGLHDAIIPLGVFSVLGHFFGTEVNAAFIAAILTILGYSINDTIVVFDRSRENVLKGSVHDFATVVDMSIWQTMARSLNTTTTTLVALLAVFFFGGATVKDFALVLLIGIFCGAYSSIFIASPLLVAWRRK